MARAKPQNMNFGLTDKLAVEPFFFTEACCAVSIGTSLLADPRSKRLGERLPYLVGEQYALPRLYLVTVDIGLFGLDQGRKSGNEPGKRTRNPVNCNGP